VVEGLNLQISVYSANPDFEMLEIKMGGTVFKSDNSSYSGV
jgi:hypothetical protein